MNCVMNCAVNCRKRLLLMLLPLTLMLAGCGQLIASQTAGLAQELSDAILNHDDPQTIAAAIPTFLITMDAMAGEDASAEMRFSAARLYTAFSGTFVDDPERQKRLSAHAWRYATTGLCEYEEDWCQWPQAALPQIQQQLQNADDDDIDALYSFATSWLGYIQANSDDWSQVASLPQVQAILERVLQLDETHDHGGAHLYLGAIATLLPPAVGGKPEVARKHFERVLQISEGKHLMAKVEYARRYARLVFDKELHHRLLTEVLATDIHVEGLTLANALAQKQAQVLLAEENDYF
jgi:hypothetical protein